MAFYMDGDNLAPKNASDAKALIGCSVLVLQEKDIDRSGRGFFFPRFHVIDGVYRRHLIADSGDYLPFKTIKELVLSDQQSHE